MFLTKNGHPQPRLMFSQHQDGRQGIIIADGSTYHYRILKLCMACKHFSHVIVHRISHTQQVSTADISAVVFFEGHSEHSCKFISDCLCMMLVQRFGFGHFAKHIEC